MYPAFGFFAVCFVLLFRKLFRYPFFQSTLGVTLPFFNERSLRGDEHKERYPVDAELRRYACSPLTVVQSVASRHILSLSIDMLMTSTESLYVSATSFSSGMAIRQAPQP